MDTNTDHFTQLPLRVRGNKQMDVSASVVSPAEYIPYFSLTIDLLVTTSNKIIGLSVYYRQFKDRYTLLKNCMLEQVIFLEGKVLV